MLWCFYHALAQHSRAQLAVARFTGRDMLWCFYHALAQHSRAQLAMARFRRGAMALRSSHRASDGTTQLAVARYTTSCTRILGKTMRDAVRNKERWKGAVRLPKILVLTSSCGSHAAAGPTRRCRRRGRRTIAALDLACAPRRRPVLPPLLFCQRKGTPNTPTGMFDFPDACRFSRCFRYYYSSSLLAARVAFSSFKHVAFAMAEARAVRELRRGVGRAGLRRLARSAGEQPGCLISTRILGKTTRDVGQKKGKAEKGAVRLPMARGYTNSFR